MYPISESLSPNTLYERVKAVLYFPESDCYGIELTIIIPVSVSASNVIETLHGITPIELRFPEDSTEQAIREHNNFTPFTLSGVLVLNPDSEESTSYGILVDELYFVGFFDLGSGAFVPALKQQKEDKTFYPSRADGYYYLKV